MKRKSTFKIKTLQALLEKNRRHAHRYKTKSLLLKLITNKKVSQRKTRQKLLDSVQVFSDYFQRVVLLRSALCSSLPAAPIAHTHLQEEFGHNLALSKDRKFRQKTWDPILEATSSWFCWKMFVLSEEEKTLLVHLVLESSANIFFHEAHKVMSKYKETDYFEIHSDVDEKHEKMGISLLKNLAPQEYHRLSELLSQGWDMINAACDRIAELSK